MKAGSAGSIPAGVTKSQNHSQPLKIFLREVGEAVAHLNTIVVGLDAVEKGHKKPSTLRISWNPNDPKLAAIKARRFALESILVRVCEALNQYVSATSRLPRINSALRKHKDHPSTAEKLSDLAKAVQIEDCFLVAGSCLLIHWRNRAVHLNSDAKLTPAQVSSLKSASEEIEKKFASLSVIRLLEDFDRKTPTLKDISTLIAMTIRLVRKIDGRLGEVSKEDLVALLIHYGLDKKIEKINREDPLQRQLPSTLQLLRTEAPGLVKAYQEHCSE